MKNRNKILLKWLINHSVKEVNRFQKTVTLLLSIAVFGTAGLFAAKTITEGYSITTLILSAIVFSASLVLALFQHAFVNNLDKLLLQEIDLTKYEDYHNYTYKKLHGKSKQAYQDTLTQVQGIVDFYKGNFIESLDKLQKGKPQKIRLPFRTAYRFNKVYFSLLSSIHKKSETEVTQHLNELNCLKARTKIQAKIKQNLLLTARAVKDIVYLQQPNDYFESSEPKNKLTAIMYTYYNALNARLSGDGAKAHELFSAIVNENPDLFYVQEAKKYLEQRNC